MDDTRVIGAARWWIESRSSVSAAPAPQDPIQAPRDPILTLRYKSREHAPSPRSLSLHRRLATFEVQRHLSHLETAWPTRSSQPEILCREPATHRTRNPKQKPNASHERTCTRSPGRRSSTEGVRTTTVQARA